MSWIHLPSCYPRLPRLALAVALATGALCTTASRAKAQAEAEFWGYGPTGAFSNGAFVTVTPAPAVIPGLLNDVTGVAAGYNSSLLLSGGAVYTWSNGSTAKPTPAPGLADGVNAIAAGKSHYLAIRNGLLYTWGDNSFRQLGNYTSVSSLAAPTYISYWNDVIAVAAGNNFSLVLRQDGTLWGAGDNQYGELAYDTSAHVVASFATDQIAPSTLTHVTTMAAGADFSLAVQGGALYTWGHNNHGQLGNGTTTDSATPTVVGGFSTGVTAIAGGGGHSLVVRNGHVYSFGSNIDGQLGNGTTTDSSTPVEIDPTDLHDITAVAANAATSYALSKDGSIWVWGDDQSGQLGLGITENPSNPPVHYTTPRHLLPPSGYVFSAISTASGGFTVLTVLSPPVSAPPSTFFTGQTAVSKGVYYLTFPGGNAFGFYSYLPDPHYVYHYDLGYEYVFDAGDGKNGVYLYDFTSGSFFYTSPTFPFPYLYDFTLQSTLYYYPDPNMPGHYNTDGVRIFYDFASQRIITK